jgi:hypothetical protein
VGTSSYPYSIDYTQGTNTLIGFNSGVYFAGSIDEVRVSSIVRSANWVTTEFKNQSNPSAFYSIGAQQQ